LYGLAGALGLNDAEHVAIIANLLRPFYEDFGIAVLLLALTKQILEQFLELDLVALQIQVKILTAEEIWTIPIYKFKME
jgi:hypothetical protein